MARELIEIRNGRGDSFFVEGLCRHEDVVPVESGGEVVAHLCLECDQQLPDRWSPDRVQLPNPGVVTRR